MVDINRIASAAYGATQKIPTLPGAPDPTDGARAASFKDLLEAGVDTFLGSQRKAEQMSADMVLGKADVNDVIFATQEASMTLETVTAIRDKIVQAYLDVLRMAI